MREPRWPAIAICQKGLVEPFFASSAFGTTCSHCNVATAVPPAAKTEDRPSEKVADRQTERERADIGPLIEDQLERLGKFKGYALERENLAVDAAARSFSLPASVTTDKLLRYEAHLDRQLYRAMDQLARLQWRRRGETVPPLLNVNLGQRI